MTNKQLKEITKHIRENVKRAQSWAEEEITDNKERYKDYQGTFIAYYNEAYGGITALAELGAYRLDLQKKQEELWRKAIDVLTEGMIN